MELMRPLRYQPFLAQLLWAKPHTWYKSQLTYSSLSGLQSRFGDKPLRNGVISPQNGTTVLKGLNCAWKSTLFSGEVEPAHLIGRLFVDCEHRRDLNVGFPRHKVGRKRDTLV